MNIINAGSRARANAVQRFWEDHQRFFRQLICAVKIPSVIAESESALAEAKSVVISLVGTGEARTREQIARAMADSGANLAGGFLTVASRLVIRAENKSGSVNKQPFADSCKPSSD